MFRKLTNFVNLTAQKPATLSQPRRQFSKMSNESLTDIIGLGDLRYISSAKVLKTFSAEELANGVGDYDAQSKIMTPVTLLRIEGTETISSQWLLSTIEQMLEKDDVFSKNFLSFVLFQSKPTLPITLEEDARSLLSSWGTSFYHFLLTEESNASGPYFLKASKLYEAYRLYDDPQGAFMYGAIPSSKDAQSFLVPETSKIPVPSRLYYGPPTTEKPLLGKRLAVKDVYDIKGLVTSASCRAYAAQYGEAEQTAPTVKKLLDQGVVLIGKTKTAQFAGGESALGWIDYQCPFDPRGDGYFDPAGSSTGSAVGVAAYDWLDVAIGTDTLGSITVPAVMQGIFGMRSTQGLMDLSGIIPVSAHFDTPGVFTRSIVEYETICQSWFGDKYRKQSSKFPSKVLFNKTAFDAIPKSNLQVSLRFIKDLEKVLEIQKEEFEVSDLWDKYSPAEITKPIDKYLETTLAHIQLYDAYHNLGKFRDDYSLDHNGAQPYVNPLIKYKWDLGAKLSIDDYNTALHERSIFKKFLEDHVFNEDQILLLPGFDQPFPYRDDWTGTVEECGANMQGFGFMNNTYSVLGGLPQFSFPIGQVPITSKRTNQTVYEPVNLIIVGAARTDGQLINLVRHVLEQSGRPTEVKTGCNAFDTEQNRKE